MEYINIYTLSLFLSLYPLSYQLLDLIYSETSVLSFSNIKLRTVNSV